MNTAGFKLKQSLFFLCAILNFIVTCAQVISSSGDEKRVQTKADLSDHFHFISDVFVRHNIPLNTIHYLPENDVERQRKNGRRGNVEHFIPVTQAVNMFDNETANKFEYLFQSGMKRYRRANSGIKDSLPSEDKLETSTNVSTSNLNKLNESVIETEVDDYSSKYKNAVVSGSGVQLHFPACPVGETIVVESFEEHYLPFSVFSVLMEFLQPAEFPLSLLKELQQKRIPFHVLLLQVIKLEGLLLLWIVLWAILSLWIPWSVVSKICCIRKKRNRLQSHPSISTINIRNRFSERFLGCFLHTILLLLFLNLLLMLGSNEQISKSLAQSPEKAETILEDLQRFVRNTEMQISFVTTTSIEFTLSAVEKDLNDIENILGTPFKEHIGEIYELDHVFRTLDYIQTYAVDVSRRVKLMTQESMLAGDAVKQFQEKLQELMPFIDNIDHQCAQKDRPLCETIVFSRFDVSFNVLEVLSDDNIKYLERISFDEDFNKSLAEAEMNYINIPRRVFVETESQRDDIRKSLMKRRTSTDNALRSLEDISRFVTSNIKSGNKILTPLLEVITSWDLWRYLVVLALSILIFIMWICLMCGAPCGCDVNKASVSYMVIAFYLASILSLFIWAMGTIALLFGAHTQNIVCKSFHDPNYKLFHQLLDNNGLLYPRGGLLKRLLKSNESINISDILRFVIQINAGAFSTLRLHHKINLNALTNYNTWDDFNYSLQNLQIETKNIKLLTYKLESTLLELQKTLQVNLTYYRLSLQKPILGKDLNAYLDQTYSVSKQISNVRTRSMFEKLIFKLTDIINNEYRYLNEKREKIIYHVTALEIILKPLIEKTQLVFRKFAHYETAFIKNSRSIGREHVKIFTSRIHNYMDQLNKHVTREIQNKVARLKPLWSIFKATKVTFCDEFIGPINSLSFSCYLLILLIMCLLPIGRRLLKSYRECYEEIDPLTKRNGSEETLHEAEQQIWMTPRIETPGTPDTVVRNLDEERVWVSPRQSIVSEAHIPPPPRPPSDTRRNPSPRAPNPTVTKSRSPFTRYDSLKLIEESSRKTSASTARPRNWI